MDLSRYFVWTDDLERRDPDVEKGVEHTPKVTTPPPYETLDLNYPDLHLDTPGHPLENSTPKSMDNTAPSQPLDNSAPFQSLENQAPKSLENPDPCQPLENSATKSLENPAPKPLDNSAATKSLENPAPKPPG